MNQIMREVERVRGALPPHWHVTGIVQSARSESVYMTLQPSNMRVPPFRLRISGHARHSAVGEPADCDLGDHDEALGMLCSSATLEAFLWLLDAYERGALRRVHTAS